MRQFSRWASYVILSLVVIAALWTLLASMGFAYAEDLVGGLPPLKLAIAWWLYLIWWRTDPAVWLWLQISGGGAAAFIVLAVGVFGVGMLRRRLQLRPARPTERWMPRPVRAASDNHGHADWLSMPELRALFPGPHPTYGGIVMGEAYRVDLDPAARLCRFDPDDASTWGQGGTAPLLVDPCRGGATHGMVFAGSGQYKTTSVVTPTLLQWFGSAVVLDTSGEVGPMLHATREAMGHQVAVLDPYRSADCGFNVLTWINTRSPLAETFIGSVVEWLCGSLPSGSDANTSFFHDQGKNLVACLLADILWDPTLQPLERTLRLLRQRVATPEDELPEFLARVHRLSASPMARDLAGTLMGLAKETFSGMYTHATKETNWLAVKAYADLVSGSSFHPADLARGRLTVFLQLPLDTLKATPAVARVIIGALLNAVYRADGQVDGRVLFLLDEAARLGPMDIIETARDAGRKYGITLLPIYQSEGQLTDQWGPTGKKKWFDSVSWRAYAGINDLDTAREISAICGEYGILTKSEGRINGSSSGMHGSSNRSRNESMAECSRALIKPEELIHDARDDEVFIIKRGARPIRCGRAIYFRRSEMMAHVTVNRFHPRIAQ
jgi:type IV secretion system protein VirD4